MSTLTMDQRSDRFHLHLTVLTQAVTQATAELSALLAADAFDPDAAWRLLQALQQVNQRARHQGLGERWAGIVGGKEG